MGLDDNKLTYFHGGRYKQLSQFGGTVIERIATEGSYVTTGAALYKIADLSRVWVQLDAYESDLPVLALLTK